MVAFSRAARQQSDEREESAAKQATHGRGPSLSPAEPARDVHDELANEAYGTRVIERALPEGPPGCALELAHLDSEK